MNYRDMIDQVAVDAAADKLTMTAAVKRFKYLLVRRAIRESNNHHGMAAEKLGISPNTVTRVLKAGQ